MKRVLTLLVVLSLIAGMMLMLCACGEKKILHCDNCGAEVEVKASSNMEEDWTIYCGPCDEELFGDDPAFDFDDNPLA